MKFVITIAFVASLPACAKDDLGTSCASAAAASGSTTNVNSSDNEIDFPATVRTDGRCEQFSCVSTQVRQEYCSKTCLSQRDCPDGFQCTILQPVGPLSTTTYCLLSKTCRPGVAADCPHDRFVCRQVTTSVADMPAYLCDVKNPGE